MSQAIGGGTSSPFSSSEVVEQSIRNKTKGSWDRYVRAQKSLAGGVSSSLRRSARPYPLYFSQGKGSRVTDVDGNSYLDYGLAWGPNILGHAPDEVVQAVQEQLDRGFTFGAQHDLEFEVAELLTSIIPCADRVCFANSGTEIVQVALRLARAATGRNKFVKFEGHYHGWGDELLVSYHPSLNEIEAAQGAAIPTGTGQRPPTEALVAIWNDCESVEQLFVAHGKEIACLICEPMLCNSGCIPPEAGFLEFLREITQRNGSLLIFDEVITGFRLDLKGAQGFYNVTPDLATYAKAIAGGLPLSALAGKSEWMNLVVSGKVIHAGTLNGNPIALAAAKATLTTLAADGGAVFRQMHTRGARLRTSMEKLLRENGHQVTTSGTGTVFQVSFMDKPARNYRDTLHANRELYSDFSLALLEEGILTLPDGRCYISAAHSDADIDATLSAVKKIIAPTLTF
jgi:glutamate-1-semialdehyde 2,1-aminomutase